MKKLVVSLVASVFLIVNSMNAMLTSNENNENQILKSWPSCFSNICWPEYNSPLTINKAELLQINPFWKKLSESADQKEKNDYLDEAQTLPTGGRLTVLYKLRAIICAQVARGCTVHDFEKSLDDYWLTEGLTSIGNDDKEVHPLIYNVKAQPEVLTCAIVRRDGHGGVLELVPLD